jgi:hypothetical protein
MLECGACEKTMTHHNQPLDHQSLLEELFFSGSMEATRATLVRYLGFGVGYG